MTRFIALLVRFLTVSLLLFPLCAGAGVGDGAALEIRSALLPFMEALQTGNPAVLAGSNGQFMEAFREALSADPQYALMIQRRYQNALFKIQDIVFPSEREAVVNISIEYPEGTREEVIYSVVRNPGGIWALEAEIQKP